MTRRSSPRDSTPEKGLFPAGFWYETLTTTVASSRVPPRRDAPFQIISAIEFRVAIAEGSAIRELQALAERFGKGSWLKRKGQAIVRLADGAVRRAELHWHEAHGIGRRWIKIRGYLDL